MSSETITRVVHGSPIAKRIDAATAITVQELKADGVSPKLCVVYVGNKEDDLSYRHEIEKQAAAVGVELVELGLPDGCTPDKLKETLLALNADNSVHGVLVQTLRDEALVEVLLHNLSNDKDPEGITPRHVGMLFLGKAEVLPCTPAAIMAMIQEIVPDLKGKTVAVVNGSPVIGRPLSVMLVLAGATPTIIHRNTVNVPAVCRAADIIVTATGRPGLIGKDHVSPGQVVIDAAINRRPDHHLCGDVDRAAVDGIVAAVTPVPDGVGPVTTATLLANVVALAKLHRGGTRTYA